MPLNDRVAAVTPDVRDWRRRIHADPELGFDEHRTASFVAETLRSFGLEVHTDVSATAVVAVLKRGDGPGRIALRAELDALPIQEDADISYASKNPGIMHACGHDGHTAILMGAAKILAEAAGFDGTVTFVFQPAEEVLGGGGKMVADGLFERFPADRVFALHNWPGLPLGTIGVRAGPQMAAVDDFELVFTGDGCHAAMPHLGDDPLLAAAECVVSLQRVVSRTIDPLSPAVVSATQIHGGRFNNFVPGAVRIEGTCRFYDADLSGHFETQIRLVAEGIAAAHAIACQLTYKRGYPPVINSRQGFETAKHAGLETVGADRLLTDFPPSMGCEDFAFMLGAVEDGAYAWIGAGAVGPRQGLHGDRYVFNDAIIPVALRYWINLVHTALPLGG